MNKYPRRGEIFWVKFDPAMGAEIKKTRPALIVSPDAANEFSKRIIVAPITSSVENIYPFEAKIAINFKECKVLLNQIRTIDKVRLGSKMTTLDSATMHEVNKALKIALDLV